MTLRCSLFTGILFANAMALMSCAGSRSVRITEFERQIVTSSQWGGVPAADSGRVHQIKYVTLHHGGEYFDPKQDFGVYLRHLQDWSRREKLWIDVPYHYLIDFDGTVYEGRNIRYAGDTNTNYDPAGHALICVPGNYEEQEPNQKQLEAVVRTMAWLCWKYNLSPEVIRGHKDVAAGTVCPGSNVYRYLANGYFVENVQAYLDRSSQE